MPPKPDGELTQLEITFLAVAARLLTAANIFAADPPGLTHQMALVGKVKEEIVRYNDYIHLNITNKYYIHRP